jgi:membrane-bound ClpP family serine protease
MNQSLILALLPLGVALLALVVLAALSRHKKRAAHELELTNHVGLVVAALRPEGAVLIDGELWRACTRAGDEIERGRVRVVGARGHLLEVEAEGGS